MKKYISILVLAVLCIGKITSQVMDPINLPLSGTQTGNNKYKAVNIQSTQLINSGKTTYIAGNEIVLNPGFEVKPGAEFEAIVENDSLNHLTLMTYNIKKQSYSENGGVIKLSGADVVAVQEIIFGTNNFTTLKNAAEMEGEGCATYLTTLAGYGIALLWKASFGAPINYKAKKIKSSSADADRHRAYIIAEFSDFCIVSTHYSLVQSDRNTMTNTILSENIIVNCKNSGKPIYIAGDFNEEPNGEAIGIFINNGNFEVLNNIIPSHATRPSGTHIDLILEDNNNLNHKIIDRGIPAAADTTYTLSDHLPYVVKVKLK